MSGENPYRSLPSVDRLAAQYRGPLPAPVVVDAARAAIDHARSIIDSGGDADATAEMHLLLSAVSRSRGVAVVNATGVLLHTNLGRALWSQAAVEDAAQAAQRYTNIEVDLETGDRSRRGSYAARLLRALTGAEDSLVVNNNSGALLLSLAATSAGKGVIVSRGELIEIGGSYRIPDVASSSGARLIEIGTTNRTRAQDYETAAQLHDCGAILKVHPSNYRVEGFTAEATVADLADVAAANHLPLIHDIGSGLLDESTPWLKGQTPEWLAGEPGARDSLLAGANLVTFSGDKLLGGPQAGVIVGSSEWVERLRRHPLARALRVDSTIHAALAATLEIYASGMAEEIPFWAMATLDTESIGERIGSVAAAVGGRVAPGYSTIGGGSAPGARIPTPQLRLPGEDSLYGALLRYERPVIARREQGDLVVDLRAVDPSDDQTVTEAISACR